MVFTFALVSGILWVLSSAAWVWSAKTEFPLERHPAGQRDGLLWGDEGMAIGEFRTPAFAAVQNYQRTVWVRNAWAAGLSAAAAFAACVALFLQ